MEAVTKDNKAVTVTLALNYGARDEIIRAVRGITKEVQAGTLAAEDIGEDTVSRHLYTDYMPDRI